MQAQRSSHATNQQSQQVSLQINTPLVNEESNILKILDVQHSIIYFYLIRTIFCIVNKDQMFLFLFYIPISFTDCTIWRLSLSHLINCPQPSTAPQNTGMTSYTYDRNSIYLKTFKSFRSLVFSLIYQFLCCCKILKI